MAGEKEYQEAQNALVKKDYDINLAIDYLTRSAQLGYPPAFVWLHMIFSLPCFNKFDISLANKWKKSLLSEEIISFITQQAHQENNFNSKFLYAYLCHYGLGVKQSHQRALDLYQECKQGSIPHYFNYLLADSFFSIGKQEFNSGNFRQAIKNFRHAERSDRNFVSAFRWHAITLHYLAEQLKEKGKIRGDNSADQLFTKAISYYKICLAYNKNDAEIHYKIGQSYCHMEQYKIAIQYLENASSIDVDNDIYKKDLIKTRDMYAEKHKNDDKLTEKNLSGQFQGHHTRILKNTTSITDNKEEKYSTIPDIKTVPTIILDNKHKSSISIAQQHDLLFYHSRKDTTSTINDKFEYHPDGGIISNITEQRIHPSKYLAILACKIEDNGNLDWDKNTLIFMEGIKQSSRQGFIYKIQCNATLSEDFNFIVEIEKISPYELQQEKYQIFFLKTHLCCIDEVDGEALLKKTKTTEFSFHEGITFKGSITNTGLSHFQGCKTFLKSINSQNIIVPEVAELPTTISIETKDRCIIL